MARATLIDGKARAAELSASITESAAELLETHGIRPGLAVVSVGDDPASKIYFMDGSSPSPLPLMHLGDAVRIGQ